MSRMKCSQSMSSLESPHKYMRTPDGSKKPCSPLNRLSTNSLNSKKSSRRTSDRKMWRRSCGSEGGSQEELWKMSILCCQESSRSDDSENLIEEFLLDYSKLCQWLNEVQLEKGRCANAASLSELAEKLRLNRSLRFSITNRAKQLAKEIPKSKEEFVWRAKHLNSQWDALEKLLKCEASNCKPADNLAPSESGKEVYDIKWMKNWIRKIENELQPLTFNIQWTLPALEQELLRHKALQAEIDEKASTVHIILRQCKSQGREASKQNKRAENLEGRWIQLRLRILEWVEHLGSLEIKRAREHKASTQPDTACALGKYEEYIEDSVEPVRKYPRLGDSHLSTKNLNNSQGSTAYFGIGIFPVPNLELDIEADEKEFFDDSDWNMGQSQDSESAYQSLSPVPNTAFEFTFEGSESIGMKRKLCQPSLSSQQLLLQVVPKMNKNISTYYFKHSDTESDLVQGISDHVNGHGHENNCIVTDYNELNGTEVSCQKALDFSQEDLDLDSNFVDIVNQLKGVAKSEASVDLEVVPFSADVEAMEAKSAQNLNEIEELVQKVESLINSNRSPRPAELGWNEMGDEDDEIVQGASACLYAKRQQFVHKTVEPTCTSRSTLRKSIASTSGSKSQIVQNIAKSKARNMSDKCRTAEEGSFTVMTYSESDNCSNRTKLPKKHARVRQWIRAHNNRTSELMTEQKNTSSCDASAESASESESESEPQLSSDDPTTVCASTVHHFQQNSGATCVEGHLYVKKGGSSSTVNKLSPSASTSGGVLGAGGIIWRSKKRNTFIKQRPKSFTDTLTSAIAQSQSFISSAKHPADYFVSDTALNYLGRPSGSGSSSGGVSPGQSATDTFCKKRHFKRKLFRNKKRSFDYEEVEEDNEIDGLMRSTSFSGGLRANQEDRDKENQVAGTSIRKPLFARLNSDNASVNTEELPTNDQDWDSYQEKYLSEPYSEELYDQDRTLKLLAFGEDYDQVLDRADSESSSIFSGFESNPRKRRPLVLKNRGEMQESDSDREEFNHFLSQCISQLRYLDVIFRKQLAASDEADSNSPAEFAEMEATCDENINSLKLVLSNVEKPDMLPFEIDVKSLESVLEQWNILKEKIMHAAKLQEIQDETNSLRGELDNFAFNLGQVDPFDANDLSSLVHKIGVIQEIIVELGGKRERLQTLNKASLGTQLFLKESHVSEDIKRQMQELYALYEENFQLGSYLLSKMRYLQEAWEDFEIERSEFEKCLSTTSGMHSKLKKGLSSAASTDSGHGTDFSHDSSVSDSDVEFKEKKQKLVALKKRASDLRSFIPPGSPVLDVIDKKINDAQRDFEILRKLGHFDPVDLKIIYPKKRSPSTSRKMSAKGSRASPTFESKSKIPISQSMPSSIKKNRNWRVFRLSLTFHLALMGLFAVAWFLQPRCCENSNTFCFSIVPHLTHERMPNI